MTPVAVLRFLSLMLVAVAMAGGLAHTFELPNKIHLAAEEYLIVQQIYRGWNLFAIPLIGGLATTIALAATLYARKERFRWVVGAAVLLVLSLSLFFAMTYPVNQETHNWTVLPANWEALRSQWEYSHAMNSALMCGAFICLTSSILWGRKSASESNVISHSFRTTPARPRSHMK